MSEQAMSGVINLQVEGSGVVEPSPSPGPEQSHRDPILEGLVRTYFPPERSWPALSFHLEPVQYLDNGIVSPTLQGRVRSAINAIETVVPGYGQTLDGKPPLAWWSKVEAYVHKTIAVSGVSVPRARILPPEATVDRVWEKLETEDDPSTQVFKEVVAQFGDKMSFYELQAIKRGLVFGLHGPEIREIYSGYVKAVKARKILHVVSID